MSLPDSGIPETRPLTGKVGHLTALLVAVCVVNYVVDDWPTSLLWPYLQDLAGGVWGESIGNLIRNLAPMILTLAARIALVVYASAILGFGKPELGWASPKSRRWVALGVIGAFALTVFNAWGLHQIPEVLSRHRLPVRLWVAPEDIWGHWAVPWVLNHFALYWLTSALGEELFYRGLLFAAIRRLSGARAAILWTSVIFAVNHFHFAHGRPLSIVDFADHALAGALFAWLREREGTLWAPFTAHAVMQILATWFDWLAAY